MSGRRNSPLDLEARTSGEADEELSPQPIPRIPRVAVFGFVAAAACVVTIGAYLLFGDDGTTALHQRQQLGTAVIAKAAGDDKILSAAEKEQLAKYFGCVVDQQFPLSFQFTPQGVNDYFRIQNGGSYCDVTDLQAQNYLNGR